MSHTKDVMKRNAPAIPNRSFLDILASYNTDFYKIFGAFKISLTKIEIPSMADEKSPQPSENDAERVPDDDYILESNFQELPPLRPDDMSGMSPEGQEMQRRIRCEYHERMQREPGFQQSLMTRMFSESVSEPQRKGELSVLSSTPGDAGNINGKVSERLWQEIAADRHSLAVLERAHAQIEAAQNKKKQAALWKSAPEIQDESYSSAGYETDSEASENFQDASGGHSGSSSDDGLGHIEQVERANNKSPVSEDQDAFLGGSFELVGDEDSSSPSSETSDHEPLGTEDLLWLEKPSSDDASD